MEANPVIGGGLHHVAFEVPDFDASLAFYKGLGFAETVAWGEGTRRAAMLDTGDGNYVEIFARGKEETPQGRIIHFALRTPDVDAAHRLALSLGAVEKRAPEDIAIQNTCLALPPQVPIRISFVRAPGGEIVEFFQNALT